MERLLAGLAALVFSPLAAAQHTHAAHEHGVAELRVVVDGSAVEIEFESPLDNLVGFEHAPGNERQRKALAAAVATLGRFDRVFVLPAAAECALGASAVDNPYERANGHDHDHGHKHDHKDQHEHDGHADLSATYTLRCATPAALDRIDVKLFEAFPRIRQIRAEAASTRGQTAATLTPKKSRLGL